MTSQYSYPALSSPRSTRLLLLEPHANFDAPLFCTLEEMFLDLPQNELRCYDALSYVWGAKEGTLPLLCDGGTVLITPNCESALRHIRYGHERAMLWIDAVCINQKDEDEKPRQVAKMGEIYSGARRVYAWLGEGNREIDCVFTVLQEFRDRKREGTCPTDFDAAEQLSFHRQLFCDIYQAKAGALPKRSDLDDNKLHEEFNWLRPLYAPCYWSRVWIVQELVLAKVVIVCCGNNSIDFDDIYGLSLDWGSFEQGFDAAAFQTPKGDSGKQVRKQDSSKGWNTIRTIRGHRRRREVVEWEKGGEASYVMSIRMSERGDVAMLDEVIGIYAQHHECSLPKDKVYGFRELVPQWKANLAVDYKRSNREVFLDVARLGLFELTEHGGWHVAYMLWSEMKLGNEEQFNHCIQRSLPNIYLQKPPCVVEEHPSWWDDAEKL